MVSHTQHRLMALNSWRWLWMRGRLVYPHPPDANCLDICIGNHVKSRKVGQLRAGPRTTLGYMDREWQAYVTFIGTATVVEEQKYWCEELARFYPGGWQGGTFAIVAFKPERIETVSYQHAIAVRVLLPQLKSVVGRPPFDCPQRSGPDSVL